MSLLVALTQLQAVLGYVSLQPHTYDPDKNPILGHGASSISGCSLKSRGASPHQKLSHVTLTFPDRQPPALGHTQFAVRSSTGPYASAKTLYSSGAIVFKAVGVSPYLLPFQCVLKYVFDSCAKNSASLVSLYKPLNIVSSRNM
jgi:hypothetical protein